MLMGGAGVALLLVSPVGLEVQDWYGAYPRGAVTDPRGPSSGAGRVDRGGGWGSSARRCRAANRFYDTPGLRGRSLGVRLARTP